MKKTDKTLNQEMGKRVKAIRNEKGYTRRYIAGELFVTEQHIYNIETGHRSLTYETALELGRIFGVSADYLLCKTDYRTPEDMSEAIFGHYDSLRLIASEFLINWLSISGYSNQFTLIKYRKGVNDYDYIKGMLKSTDEYEVILYLFAKDNSPIVINTTASEECDKIPFFANMNPDNTIELSPKDLKYLPAEILDSAELLLKHSSMRNKYFGRGGNDSLHGKEASDYIKEALKFTKG